MLLAAAELVDNSSRVETRSVIRHCEGTVIESRMPDHEASIDYAAQIGLMKLDGKHVLITEAGRSFIAMNPEKLFDLSEDQRKFLLKMCYFQGPFSEICRRVLANFSPSYTRDTYRWSWVDGPPMAGQEMLLEQLRELSLVTRGDSWYEVNPEFVSTVASFLAEGKGFTEEQFLEYLEEKKEVGDLAESLVLKWEAERLRRAGYVAESMSVRSISKLRVDAGYDIDSFDGDTPNMQYNRFIEVKGARSSKVRFFWSDNEIEIAKQLGERYWIYFQGGISPGTGTAKNEVLMFRNPIEAVLNDNSFIKTTKGYWVEAHLSGKKVLATETATRR